MKFPVQRIGIFAKTKPASNKESVRNFVDWLRQKELEVFMDTDTAAMIDETSALTPGQIAQKSDMIAVLGGDGTLLSAARQMHRFNVPLLAVNMGNLGFLTDVPRSDLYEAMEKVLNQDCKIEKRMLLSVRVTRPNEKTQDFHVLNDLVINKGVLARIVDLEVMVDGKYMTSYRADGLIIATPTGSTAYSLSAGGPIIHPSIHNLILSPICPFTLTNRPIIIPDDSEIGIHLASENEDVRLTLDGQEGCEIRRGDEVIVHKAKTSLKLIRASDKTYYQILREKLNWGSKSQKNG
ncbi:MAG: NAD(+)/NADH kinase [Candidatus Nitrohelix vancouverensis]|uniref:NAD kinase n=1 Tax=Candidatus Nitrohelix vancouverensis TaxID=2705534 RepID=A0A7T0C1D5_9BACT|nr:MAG: NAD(+)/NADH kinase [Candidatus Nitrohelix vancouverensis]